MKIETGMPPCDGRFVVYVQPALSEHVEPVIADRLNGNWLWRKGVLGWIGPLPAPPRAEDLRAVDVPPMREYDL